MNTDYKVVNKIFNDSEEAFFLELHRQLPKEYFIFPKVRIIDFIEPNKKALKAFTLKMSIIQKHVDFLICDYYFNPILAIEVDGKSHNKQHLSKSDLKKDTLFESLPINFERVDVGSDFNIVISKLFKKINQKS